MDELMTDQYQSTLRAPVSFAGKGLHSGREVRLEVCPAPAGSGIVFLRTDLESVEPIRAYAANIISSELSTTIGRGCNTVATIEHLMAALAGLGIDNAVVRIDGPEVPIVDGSAAPFVDGFLAAGIAKVSGYRKMLVVRESFQVEEDNKLIRVEPARSLSFECSIDYGDKVIGKQSLAYEVNRSSFLSLCGSRTFCHVRDVDAMRAAGLALGGSLENAVVVTDDGVMNQEGLRFSDEFVRHKLLDCIGDLALLGAPLVGRVTLKRAGHALHARFMREILARKHELLAVVDLGDFRGLKPAVPENIVALRAAAALYG
jgi:UDP-3-O-[3-hydroxymyristoyl] N-acetylglucosamine deacetylase